MAASAKKVVDPNHIIYTDGACSGNPGPGGWASIVAMHVDQPNARVQELGGFVPATTNNKMELQSVIEALVLIRTLPGAVVILTDSVYVIKGATQWIFGWRTRGWKNAQGEPVANQEQWEELHRLLQARKTLGPIEWRYVRGHQGTDGNERCDEIAVAFSKGDYVSLYKGSMAEYLFLIAELPEIQPLPEMKSRTTETTGAKPTYLSLVDGVVNRHATWSACEALVKGRSGAKFKKVASPLEEKVVLQAWGVDPSQVRSK